MNALKRAKWGYLLYSILLSLLGLALIIWPNTSAETFCIIIGAISLVYGVVKVVEYFKRGAVTYALFQFDLAGGVFLAIIGAVLLLHPRYILTFLPVVIGFYMIIDGVMKVQTSIDAKRFGLRAWWLILTCALLGAALGVYLLFNPLEGGAVLMIVIGVSMLFNGVQNIFNALYTAKMVKNVQDAFSEPIDVNDFKMK